MRDAQHGEFNVLLAEALDRISRYQADVATLYKHLKFAGVTIVTLAEGEISELHVGPKGTMNALFLKDLAMKTHRGLRGRVEKGKAGGGLCYGYHRRSESRWCFRPAWPCMGDTSIRGHISRGTGIVNNIGHHPAGDRGAHRPNGQYVRLKT